MAEDNNEDSLELVEDTENITQDNQSTNDATGSIDSADLQTDQPQEFAKKKKPNIIKIVLFSVIGLLALVLIAGIALYFLGYFDSKQEIVKETKMQTSKTIQKKEEKFTLKDINTKNLNKQLAELTNKTIKEEKKAQKIAQLENEKKLLEEEKERYKQALDKEENKLTEEKKLLENKRNELEKQKQILEDLKKEALLLKNELEEERESLEENNILNQMNFENKMSTKNENISKVTHKNKLIENNETTPNNNHIQKMGQNNFLLLINVAKIKGELYKDYLDSIAMISPNLNLCRDDNNIIEIYFGPFKSQNERSDIYNILKNRNFVNSFEVELTKEEFNRRCNY